MPGNGQEAQRCRKKGLTLKKQDVVEKLKGFILRTFSIYGYAVGVRKMDALPLERLGSGKYCWLLPSSRYWYADPMVRKIRGNHYVFTEQFDLNESKGKIAVSEIKNGKIGKPRTVIDEPFHLSFPNVFEYDGAYYMVPECSASHAVKVYRMGASVYDWKEFLSIPMENCVDTAVLRKQDDIYLITSELDKDDILRARKIVIEIKDFPHGQPRIYRNPNAAYSYAERNGGDLLCENGRLYCVNQVSTPTAYGQYMELSAFTLNEDCTVTERKVSTIQKEDVSSPRITYPLLLKMDTHTYSVTSDFRYEAVDIGCTYFSIENLIRKKFRK